MKRHKIILLILVIAIIIGARFLRLDEYINFAVIKDKREDFLLFVNQHYRSSVFLYLLSYVAIVAVSLPLGAVMSVVGGFLYGTFWGAVFSNLGATSGAVVAFLVVRYVLGDYIQGRYKNQLASFNADFDRYGASYLLLVHLIAFVPFFIVNIAAGLTRVSLWTFIWTTFIGILPGAFVYTYAGQQLQKISSMRDVFTPHVLIIFLIITLFVAIPIIVMRIRKKEI